MDLADLTTEITEAVEIVPPHWVDDDALIQLEERYEPLIFERFADGTLLVTPLAGLCSGIRSATLSMEICSWCADGERGRVSANGGFNLRDGSLFAPNATFVAHGRCISPESERLFPVIVPDAVFELLSNADKLETTMKKVRAYLRNGVALVVLIDPYRPSVQAGRAGDEELFDLGDVDSLDCSPVMPGFVLDVATVLAVG